MQAGSSLACSAGLDGQFSDLVGDAACSGGPVWEGGPLRVYEFFSGIGGLRVGLTEALESLRRKGLCEIATEVVGAYDISTTANGVYTHNFKTSPICLSIEHLSLQHVDGQADLWLLSPPCQPYTRGGKKLDSLDGRATGFLHLLQLLSGCCSPPQFIFLENVRGFEGSDTWRRMQQVLRSQHYRVQHFLLSPTQIGIPNTRVRYYCLGCRDTTQPLQQGLQLLLPELHQQQGNQKQQQPLLHIQGAPESSQKSIVEAPELQMVPPISSGALGGPPFEVRCVGDFLEVNITPEEQQALRIPAGRLRRFIDVNEETETVERGRKATELEENKSGAGHGDGDRRERECRTNTSDTENDAEERQGEWAIGEENSRIANTKAQSSRGNGFRLEIVSPTHTACGTFTKGYGRNLHSGGPLLLISEGQSPPRGREKGAATVAAAAAATAEATTVEVDNTATASSEAVSTETAAAATSAAAAAVLTPQTLERSRFRRLQEGETIRFFSSRELLRLHGFPESFAFPSSLPFRKRAALVGNSVNVKVVALLLEYLLQQHVQRKL
ncbi:DNA methyltransferase 2, putative [Eimeria maxima]|uniref:DNA methyltransferase 2, putative n=1 Tax=Eimeria maxima TaxID=5804 RepID=U6M7M6_EIMMA|nr:DNA methyltransferase 2, putative [Eimeria maxima]CDJ59053.1 DNA methyltransferase 2, putative [Eimeria maxima]